MMRDSKEGFDIALQYFNKAKEIDPNYAPAYLSIATLWIMRANMLSANPEEATAMAKSNLAKAFKLDSTSTEVYAI